MKSAPHASDTVSPGPIRVEEPERLAVVAAIAVLLAVAVAQASDLLTFVRMVSVAGVAAELNPLVAHGAGSLGFLPLIVAKAALVLLVVAVFAIVARTNRRLAATVATAGMVAGLIGAYSNVLAIT
ncbi:MAG: hypothetical protein ACJ771_03035 [Chloroflexota bacterium]